MNETFARDPDEARHAAELLELGDAFFELDRDWRIVRVNRRQEELSGRPRSQTVGRLFAEVWPELASDRSRYFREYRRCMEERVPVQFEEHYPPLDLWTGVTAYPVSDGGIAVFFRDIGAQKAAEDALRASEERFRSVLENMSEGVMLFDAGGNLTYQNPASLRIHGFEPGADGRIERDDLPQTWNAWDEHGRPIGFDAWPVSRVFRGERFQHQVLRVERAETGYVFHGSYNGAPIRVGPDGRVAAGFITIREITDQIRADAERSRAALALRASEEKFRSVFEQAAIGMGRVRFEDARWVDVNDAFCHMLGRSREELLRTPWPEMTHPEDLDLDLAPFRRMAAGALHSYTVEKRFIHADGHAVWAKLTLSLVRDANGRPDYEIAIIEDVGDRKRAEQALSRSEHRLRAIFEGAAVGIVEVDEEDRFVAVNGRFCAMLGYAREELLGKRPHDVTAPEDLPATTALNARGHTGEVGRFDYEKRYVRKDGTRVWVHVTVSVVRDAEGRFVRAVGTAEDVTARRRAEEELGESRARIEAALASATDAVFVSDAEGRIVELNDAFVRFHRFASRGDCEARLSEFPRLFEVLHPDGTAAGEDAWALSRARRGEKVTAAEFTLVRRDTGERWIGSFSSAPILDRRGRIVGTVTVARDVTETRRAEEALRRSEEALRDANERLRETDRRKDEFLGMLSHELRNPLAPIRNALYILDRAQPGGQQAQRAKDIASRQVAHLTRLVDDLLDVTRIARGKIELRRERLDLAALARRTAEDYRPLMQDRGLDLAIDVAPDAVVVSGDPARLTQVLGNLLNNAAKFTPAGGRVTLALRADRDRAVVQVRDTGPGISPDVLPTLFEPFTQGKQTLARSEGGLGLGLSLVKGLVALHGGEVTATTAPGGGAQFVVRLPLALHAAQGPAARLAPGDTGGPRKRVLVVDDNHDAADTVAELARMLGHEAEVAYDAAAALARAAHDPPDVIFCDIGLPGMDGYEFARRFRALPVGRRVRLVALSGYAQPEDVARAMDSGFDAHVAKPPAPEKLEQLLGAQAAPAGATALADAALPTRR